MTGEDRAVWSSVGFNQRVDNLMQYGPTAHVGVAAVPYSSGSAIAALAQFDTGAAGTGISPRLVERLGLKPIGLGVIQEAGREALTASFFALRLWLPGIDRWIDLDVAGLPSLADPHDVLIGRDVMSSFKLVVDFTSGATQLHFKVK
ncbi:retropepsin-like domain-containing protein [Aminobacter sp. SR38]|jgi:hypothetical protein|uniref:aspartyl protease family protein n=1 Tax=Aminobacter sp. SR38 TaxID=2774562 RepID=UPI0017815AAC|nr:aspartyl protease family protein [Aminobacter sp. SR38]QOF73621.1 retropepsin-like domain-containing protein [Aminobacter sp. SR38]